MPRMDQTLAISTRLTTLVWFSINSGRRVLVHVVSASSSSGNGTGVDPPTQPTDIVAAEEQASMSGEGDKQALFSPQDSSAGVDHLKQQIDESVRQDVTESKKADTSEGASQSDSGSGEGHGQVSAGVAAQVNGGMPEQPGTQHRAEALAPAQETASTGDVSVGNSEADTAEVPEWTPVAPGEAPDAEPSKIPNGMADEEPSIPTFATGDAAPDMVLDITSDAQPGRNAQLVVDQEHNVQSRPSPHADMAVGEIPDIPLGAHEDAPAKAASDGTAYESPGTASRERASETGALVGEAQQATFADEAHWTDLPNANRDSSALVKVADKTAPQNAEASESAPAEVEHTDSGHGHRNDEEDICEDKRDKDDSIGAEEEEQQPVKTLDEAGKPDAEGGQTLQVAEEEEEEEYYDTDDRGAPVSSGTRQQRDEEDEYYDEPESPENLASADGDEAEDGEDEDEEEEEDDEEEELEADMDTGASQSCDTTGCSSEDTDVDPKHAWVVQQAIEWAANTEVGAIKGVPHAEGEETTIAESSTGEGFEFKRDSMAELAEGRRDEL